MSERHQWPCVGYEELPWKTDPEDLALVSKTARRRILPTYEAAIPLNIAGRLIELPQSLSVRMSELLVSLARFDSEQEARGYDLPALLLRSESSTSSQIENLTSSVRNVALAEVSEDAPRNARLISGNVAAMRRALSGEGDLTLATILEVHRCLMAPEGEDAGGELRDEQVWIGGTPYSPHGARYVPPQASLVPEFLDDLVRFASREDVGPITKAAVLHAQFETIHPFVDGNGRTGRTLLHRVLKSEGVLNRATIPVSAGLLHDVDDYIASLEMYREGDPVAVVGRLVEALELALAVARLVASEIDEIFEGWYDRMTERRGSSIHRLPGVLAGQPVVDVSYLSAHLGVTARAARDVVAKACDYGILRPLGNRRRGEFYQSDELIDVLEEISSMEGIRRALSR